MRFYVSFSQDKNFVSLVKVLLDGTRLNRLVSN